MNFIEFLETFESMKRYLEVHRKETAERRVKFENLLSENHPARVIDFYRLSLLVIESAEQQIKQFEEWLADPSQLSPEQRYPLFHERHKRLQKLCWESKKLLYEDGFEKYLD